MSCCKPIHAPDNFLDIDHLGGPCSTYSQLSDMFIYIPEERLNVTACDLKRYKVKYSTIDSLNYLFVVEDQLTGNTVSYSVEKDYIKEPPQATFDQDFINKQLCHSRNVLRALEDMVEGFKLDNIDKSYQLVYKNNNWYIITPLSAKMAKVIFQIEVSIVKNEQIPIPNPQGPSNLPNTSYPVLTDLALARLIDRYKRMGVMFEDWQTTTIPEYETHALVGYINRSIDSYFKVTLKCESTTLNDSQLLMFHNIYAE